MQIKNIYIYIYLYVYLIKCFVDEDAEPGQSGANHSNEVQTLR